jgi:hypothetical protein
MLFSRKNMAEEALKIISVLAQLPAQPCLRLPSLQQP